MTEEKNIEPKKKLEGLGKKLVKDIDEKKNPSMEIPVRSLSNVSFDQKTKMLSLGAATSNRYFFNVSHIRKFVQTIEVAGTAKELMESNKHISLRQAFYKMKRTIPNTSIDIVEEQSESDSALEDLELITGCSREQMHINAKKAGSIAGNVIIEDSGDVIDWSKMGSGGWSIPSNVEEIKFRKVDAKFIIYMEKDTMWTRINEDKYWKKANCIIVASQGQSTRGIRRLLQRLHLEYGLPIYVLVDADPWGAYIYSVLKFGSISLAHTSETMAIPGARFLGLSAEDIEKYDLKKHIIKFKDVDKARIKQIRNYDWFKDNKDWQKQFDLWEKFGGKVELDALVAKGVSFISEKYLPEKLKNKDWLE